MAEADLMSPESWFALLGPKLMDPDRQDRIAYWKRYYDGDHDLPAGPNQHKEAYQRFQRMARLNLCALAADSMVHRMQAIGYRDGTRDNRVWNELWQPAKMDARQYGLYTKAYSRRSAYAAVSVSDRGKAKVAIEGPENMYVELDPSDPTERLAGIRVWHDSVRRRWLATLVLPGARGLSGQRFHYQTQREFKTSTAAVTPLSFDLNTTWELRDPMNSVSRSFSEVPFVPFINADEGEEGKAAFAKGIDSQNRLNLTLLNRLSSERYAAFRQAILLNFQLDEDPVTGEPIAPWKPGVTQIGAIPPPEPGDPAPSIVQLQQTSTADMLRGAESDMRGFAAETLTPVYYLPGGDMVNLSADAVGALDAGHNAKIAQRMATFGEGLEEVLALMAEAQGIDRDLTAGEIVWARPENFSRNQIADYASKMVAAGVPITMVAEEIGWSPQRVAQLRTELTAQAMRAEMAQPVQATATRQSQVPDQRQIPAAQSQ